MNYSRINGFHWLALALVLVLILPVVVQDGMFMDGIQYACVSKNLAAGEGSFWFPWLNESWIRSDSSYFMEHPPLVYGIQSLFFYVLGDSMYTERMYSLLMALLSAWIIHRIWKTTHDEEKNLLSWLPVCLWIITPVCFWAYQNNVQENTLGVFSLLAVWCVVLGCQGNRAYIYFTLAGFLTLAAFLCKGVPGLFPLAAVFFYFISFRKTSWQKMCVYSLVTLVSFALLFMLIGLYEPARESLQFYFYERLIQRIDEEPTVNSRFFILGQLIMELLPMIGAGAVVWFTYGRKENVHSHEKKHALFFLLVGFSASLPLMLTGVQRGFYMVPAFPFFALSAGFLVENKLRSAVKRILENTASKRRWFISGVTSVVLVITVSVVFFAGRTSRDKEVLHDVHLMGKHIPYGTSIDSDKEIYNTWNLHFYLTRYYGISFHPGIPNPTYLLVKTNQQPDDLTWKRCVIGLTKYDLYKKVRP